MIWIYFQLTAIPCPPTKILSFDDVFEDGKPNIDVLKAHFILEGRIEEAAALKIINDGAAIMRTESTMLEIEAPVTGK